MTRSMIFPVPPSSAQWRCIYCDRAGSKPVAHAFRKLRHTQKKLAAPSIAVRFIAQIDDEQLDPWQF